MKIEIGVATNAGTRHRKGKNVVIEGLDNTNQDRYFLVAPGLENSKTARSFSTAANSELMLCFGVFDGHGPKGHLAAEIAKDSFQNRCNELDEIKKAGEITSKEKELVDFMKSTFHDVHRHIIQSYDTHPTKSSIPPSPSSSPSLSASSSPIIPEYGTTATVIIVDAKSDTDGLIVTACAGDSKAILGVDGSTDEAEVLEITGMHRATDIKEQKRLKADFAGKIRVLADGYIQPEDKEWWRHQLQLTRSLGHRGLQHFGVIPDPTVFTFPLSGKERVLIVASDGLWDGVSDKEVLRVAMDATSAQSAAEDLVSLGQLNAPHPAEVDDTTVVVAFFLDD
eukprot:TRINITY_DN10983_c0_g1_i1.p1 TRINITY_DN10983_c0_g1~~TRINITY_DN10983_c0_g1_i1.p1  ORF type:complete len:338 (-),score=93.76 TRINITY_DN10983_c0_g1_i1:214-1227(-)